MRLTLLPPFLCPSLPSNPGQRPKATPSSPKRRTPPWLKPWVCLVLWLSAPLATSWALVPADPQNFTHAVKYGLSYSGGKIRKVLGTNWVEGAGGALLNVYSPYMVVAVKAFKLKGIGYPPSEKELKEAKAKCGREISYFQDPNNVLEIKMAVFLQGETATWPKGLMFRLKGDGNGRSYELKPRRTAVPKAATESAIRKGIYEAIVSGYFRYSDVEKLEGDYRLVIERADGTEWVSFKLNNDWLY
jgi:hypothetical protein